MTWKKTKVMALVRRESVDYAHLMLPYRVRDYRAHLPKGWMRMCKQVGLRPTGRHVARKSVAWRYLRGAGRFWRLTASGALQASARYADFDRWSNSIAATFPIPTSSTELRIRMRFTTYDT